MDWWQILSIDVPPLLTATFSAIACALLGNYLVLRRLSLMGDAISHSVLPGIVVAFLITSSRGTLPVFFGAAVAAILSAVLIEVIRVYGRVESGAAMGVVFSIFFALGVLLIEQAAARSVDLDADCLLHGQLESIFWNPPQNISALLSFKTLTIIPNEVVSSLAVMLLSVLFVGVLYKELKISSFDPALATSLGFSSTLLHYLLMIVVACAIVASFKAVGSILVIAMIICPAAAARLLTDKLFNQLILSVVIAACVAVSGYILGAFGPLWLGYNNSVNTAGMMAVMSGVMLTMALVFAPAHGVLAKGLCRLKLSLSVRADDILAFLYRVGEASSNNFRPAVMVNDLLAVFKGDLLTHFAMYQLKRLGLITKSKQALILSDSGAAKARNLVRTHRLWEAYLVNHLGLDPDHVHSSAERLEHFTGSELQQRIAEKEDFPVLDPHGRDIPK